MIMQVLSQGPSLLLAVWTGLALLEGGESLRTCSYSCGQASTESSNVRHGINIIYTCEGKAISWCSTTDSSEFNINSSTTTPANAEGIMSSWLTISSTSSGYTVQCENTTSCVEKWNVTVVEPVKGVKIRGSQNIEYTTPLRLTCTAFESVKVDKYQLYHNGTSVQSTFATTGRYVKTSAQLNDSGYYHCEACNWANCKNSSNRHVRVTAPYPAISSLTADPGSKVVVGRVARVRLTCTARGTSAAVQFTWRLNNTSYIPQSNNSESYFTSTHTRSTLTISPVTAQHNGDYSCTSTNTATGETDSRTHYIQVIDPPDAEAVISPQGDSCSGRRSGSTYSALNGTSHRFDCQSAGSPPLSSYWSISTLSTNVNKAATFSTMLSHNDEGMYVCTVRNTAESDLEDTEEVTVKVYDPPVLSVLQSSVKVKEGDRLDLQCTFTKHMNDPNSFPTITWNNSSGRRVSQKTQGLTLTSTYKRSSASRGDSGVYTCSVNICPAIGELTDSVTVTVYYVPDAVNISSIEVTNTTFDTISIQWTPPNDNFDTIIDYRVYLYGSGGHVVVFNSSQPMTTLESLQPFTTYQIRISAENNAGWGGNSSEKNVNTLTRDEVLASNVTYSTLRVGVSSYTVKLRWAVPKGLLTDKLEGYRLSRWPTNIANIETTTVNRDNVSCAWNVTAIGSETYCHEWEGFSPGSQYTVSLEIIYNYGILSTGGPTNVTITIPTLPSSQGNPDLESVFLAVGAVLGVLLVVLVTTVVIIVVLLICKRCRRKKTSGKSEAYYYNQRKGVFLQQEVVSCDTKELSSDPRYKPLDLSSVQQSSYSKLNVGSKSSDSMGVTQGTKHYEYPSSKPTPKKKPKPKKKPSKKIPIQPNITEDSATTGNKPKYVNMEIMAEPPSGIEQSPTTATKNNEYINVGYTSEQPGQTEKSSSPTNIKSNPYVNIELAEAEQPGENEQNYYAVTRHASETSHHQVPPSSPVMKVASAPQQLSTTPKHPLLPPTQQSATPKPQTKPSKQKPNPIKTRSPSDSKPPIAPKAKKPFLVQGSTPPEPPTSASQPQTRNKVPDLSSPGSSVAELRKKLEKSLH